MRTLSAKWYEHRILKSKLKTPRTIPSSSSSDHSTKQSSKLAFVVTSLYLLTLILLPWSWFPPFPWLHEHAQWSDAVFAVTTAFWLIERWQHRPWPRLRSFH